MLSVSPQMTEPGLRWCTMVHSARSQSSWAEPSGLPLCFQNSSARRAISSGVGKKDLPAPCRALSPREHRSWRIVSWSCVLLTERCAPLSLRLILLPLHRVTVDGSVRLAESGPLHIRVQEEEGATSKLVRSGRENDAVTILKSRMVEGVCHRPGIAQQESLLMRICAPKSPVPSTAAAREPHITGARLGAGWPGGGGGDRQRAPAGLRPASPRRWLPKHCRCSGP
jgi:hypothetical protein